MFRFLCALLFQSFASRSDALLYKTWSYWRYGSEANNRWRSTQVSTFLLRLFSLLPTSQTTTTPRASAATHTSHKIPSFFTPSHLFVFRNFLQYIHTHTHIQSNTKNIEINPSIIYLFQINNLYSFSQCSLFF